jgi:hypothetical protein
MRLLESAKDWILELDTLGQQVPPHVRYGMACLVIRNTISNVSCLDEWGMTRYFSLGATWCKRGMWGQTLALQAGSVGETIAKHDICI